MCLALYGSSPPRGRVSAQTDRKRCENAKGSVKFRNVREEQESRRTRREIRLTITKAAQPSRVHEQQPGRILETVNSDNKKSDPAFPPPGFSFPTSRKSGNRDRCPRS